MKSQAQQYRRFFEIGKPIYRIRAKIEEPVSEYFETILKHTDRSKMYR